MNLTSPNYPGYYFTLLTCNYTITAPEGYKVLAEFRDFDVDPTDPFIIEGSLIGGRFAPIVNYTSEDETMEISFKSDSGYIGMFWLQISAFDCAGMSKVYSLTLINHKGRVTWVVCVSNTLELTNTRF